MARLIIRQRKGKHDKKESEYYAPDEEHDYHTEFGAIPKQALQRGGTYTLGKERFVILTPSFTDRYVRLSRGAQIVQPKDLGLVIAETGLGKDSVVLDIGAGSGFSAALFARVAKAVHTYDVDERSLQRTTKNLSSLGLTNVTVAKGDAYDAATIPHEGEIDLFFLDVPEPWRALATAEQVLKHGAHLVSYSPCITQTMRVVEAAGESLLHVKTVEVLVRRWKVDGQAVRPESEDFQHTAFLSFFRRV